MVLRILMLTIFTFVITPCYAGSFYSDYGTSIEGFEDASDWTPSGDGEVTDDTTNFIEGSGGIRTVAVDDANTSFTKTINLDLSNFERMSFWVYTETRDDLTGIAIQFSSETDFSSNFYREWNLNPIKRDGWNRVILLKDDFTNNGSESWDNTMIRMRVYNYPANTNDCIVTFDDMRIDYVAEPIVVWNVDDGLDDTYDTIYPILKANDQQAVAFINSNNIGSANYMTLAELQELYADGWDISNHTESHNNLPSATESNKRTHIETTLDYIVDNNMRGGERFFSYPGGAYDAESIAVVSETQSLARKVGGDDQPHWDMNLNHGISYVISGVATVPATSAQDIKDDIDRVIETQGLLSIYLHGVVESNPTGIEWDTERLQEVSDYLKTQEDSGNLKVLTYSEYYDRISNYIDFDGVDIDGILID